MKGIIDMGRKKVDRSDKIMQTFETTKPLKARLKSHAKDRKIKKFVIFCNSWEKLSSYRETTVNFD